ncbi:hypothetical protein CASFOL_013563 [Castilleja foliolosa]|uniref:DUF7138 domain-containing protein n=1 Tax=Castilleja foliolosa TaxID=1961234 RepID=A0ABD3DKB5_9LAMI
MAEGRRGRGPSFPVVFFDGEREMNIGDVKINPTLEYKQFQVMLSQKIGVSPNQISIYLVDRKRNPKSSFTGDRRRTPITGKVNFGLICHQKDCCFLVVLKRSRRSRNRRERTFNGEDFADFWSESDFSSPPRIQLMPQNVVLVRRNQPLPLYNQITQPDLAGLDDSGHGIDTGSIRRMGDWRAAVPVDAMTMTNNGTGKLFCEECENAERDGDTTSFHHCVNDAVIAWFTPKLGPIKRIG